MRINLSRFKKTKEDNDRATLEDDRGHSITLSKKALRPHILKQLTTLPVHLKDGGSVMDDVPDDTIVDPQAAAQEKLPSIPEATQSTALMAMNQSPNPMAAPQEPEQQPAPAPQPMPGPGQQMADPYAIYMGGMQQQVTGLQQEANAAGEMGKQQAKAYEDFANSRRDEMMQYQQHFNDLNNERQNLLKDYKSGTIDPKHFMNDLSSGQKIAMSIGILLSGISAGVTGKENMAMDFLNKQIDRDIQGQRDRLGKTESLLSANLKDFGNLHDAMTMTRINMNDILADKIAQTAATSAYPMAQAKAQAAIGALHANSAQAIPQLAMSRMQMQYMQGGGNDQNASPSAKIRKLQMIGMIKPEQAEHLYKQVDEAQAAEKGRNDVLAAFDKAAKLNTISNRAMNPFQAKKQVDALIDPVIAKLSKDTAGRFSEQDASYLKSLLYPSLTANKQTIDLQRNRINQMFNEKFNFSELKDWGIVPGGGGRFDQTGRPRFQEGQAVKPK